jgi:hypothetical protein
MTGPRRTRLVATGGGLAALVLSAAALAQTETFSPREESDALVADVAEQLGIEPSRLTDALREAYTNRIDQAVEDGRLTAEQADALKERLETGDVPLLMGPWDGHGPGHGFHGGHGFSGGLDAAAEYLGLSEDELRMALEDGDTFADVAEAQDKAVDGLVDAMVAAARADLDEAVEEGRITEELRDSMLSTLEERIRDHVNEGFRHVPGGPGHRGPGPFFGSGDAA